MLNRDIDHYACAHCNERWTVEKRTGTLHMATLPAAYPKQDRRRTARLK
jgi:hypothetical protein